MLILNACSLQNKMLSNLTCVFIYSLTKCVLEDVSENFVKLSEIYPCQSLLLRKLQYLELPLFEQALCQI